MLAFSIFSKAHGVQKLIDSLLLLINDEILFESLLFRLLYISSLFVIILKQLLSDSLSAVYSKINLKGKICQDLKTLYVVIDLDLRQLVFIALVL